VSWDGILPSNTLSKNCTAGYRNHEVARAARHRYGAVHVARGGRGPPGAVRWVERDLDAEMVAIARAIIGQRTGSFDPTRYRDRYQEALAELIEAKMKGLTVKPKEMAAPPPVIDLLAALKRSLAQESPASQRSARLREKTPRQNPIGVSRPCCARRRRA
jgi:hypothetical protein